MRTQIALTLAALAAVLGIGCSSATDDSSESGATSTEALSACGGGELGLATRLAPLSTVDGDVDACALLNKFGRGGKVKKFLLVARDASTGARISPQSRDFKVSVTVALQNRATNATKTETWSPDETVAYGMQPFEFRKAYSDWTITRLEVGFSSSVYTATATTGFYDATWDEGENVEERIKIQVSRKNVGAPCAGPDRKLCRTFSGAMQCTDVSKVWNHDCPLT